MRMTRVCRTRGSNNGAVEDNREGAPAQRYTAYTASPTRAKGKKKKKTGMQCRATNEGKKTMMRMME